MSEFAERMLESLEKAGLGGNPEVAAPGSITVVLGGRTVNVAIGEGESAVTIASNLVVMMASAGMWSLAPNPTARLPGVEP